MKLAFVSDLHFHVNQELEEEIIEGITRVLHEEEVQYFCLIGDLSPSLSHLDEIFASLVSRNPGVNFIFVPGNHDIWINSSDSRYLRKFGVLSPTLSSLTKYEQWLKLVSKRHGVHYLPGSPLVINNRVVMLGTIGWYDYSFRNPTLRFPLIMYKEKQLASQYWMDYFSAQWNEEELENDSENSAPWEANWRDRRVLSHVLKKMKEDCTTVFRQLSKQEVHPSSLLILTHHLPFRELVIYKQKEEWDYFAAFMGAEDIGKVIKECALQFRKLSSSLETYVFCGHLHQKRTFFDLQERIYAETVPLGYYSEFATQLESMDLQAVIQKAIRVQEF